MKKLLLVLAIFGLAVSVYASGKTDTGGTVVNFYGHSDNDPILKEMIAAFEKTDPGFKVEYHSIPNDDYDDKIRVLTAGSSDIDALWIRTPAQAQQYITNKALLDLTPFINESKVNTAPIKNALTGAARDGKIYGLPTTGSCWMTFYNKDLFDAKGLPYPIDLTWDEYLDLAKKLTYTENGVKYWGGACPPWSLNLGSAAGNEYLTASEPTPLTRRYAQVLHRMYIDDKSHPSIEDMSVGSFDIMALFDSGTVYMMIMGDWEFNLFKGNFNLGVAPMPILSGMEKGSSVGQASYYCISPKSKHAKEAYQFIEWATTTAGGTTVYANQKQVPSYSTPESLAAYKKLVTVDGVDYRFSSKILPEQGPEPYYGQINDEAYIPEMQLYLLGEQTLDQAFNNFYKLRAEIIAKNK
ncbi:sugar ABC transporter substrate-binding protein [Spirochaetia bacterium]|nr:sugar ABC transporter substrate-binding protein [Spirochaetia bacterium]GHU31039.1 sugar ABC transporter substrate-binding protein [Spirochaetia bacterium]